MKIWHIGAYPSPNRINGINNTIWPVAIQQCQQGHHVSLILEHQPDQLSLELAHQFNLQLIELSSNRWQYHPQTLNFYLNTQPPDLVHFHSIFIAKQATLSWGLKQRHIPYVITPNAITPQLLRRDWLKKWIYSLLIEKSRFRNAAAISIVTPQEGKALKSFIPNYSGLIDCIPNPVDLTTFNRNPWSPQVCPQRIVYLGRFDVWHKGIDRLVEIGKQLPEFEFHFYGIADKKTQHQFSKIQQNSSKNVYFHPPVFGAEKIKVLQTATLYIQMARWEVFGISIAEAMAMGVPCAIANTINLADIFQAHNLGLVLSTQPSEAAQQLREILKNPTQLQTWSRHGRAFAQAHFQAPKIATQYLNLYQAVLNTTAEHHQSNQSYVSLVNSK